MFLHKLCFLDIGSPQKVHKVDIKSGSLQEVHRKSTGSPQEVHKKSTKSPQKVHRKSTGSPQKVHRKSTESPQEVHRKSTESPQKVHRRVSLSALHSAGRVIGIAGDAGWMLAMLAGSVPAVSPPLALSSRPASFSSLPGPLHLCGGLSCSGWFPVWF